MSLHVAAVMNGKKMIRLAAPSVLLSSKRHFNVESSYQCHE
jgi:hypothetical protein